MKISIHCKMPNRPIEVKTQHCFHQNESMLNDCYQSISQSVTACLFIQSEPIECLELYSHKYQSPCCNVCSHVPNIDFARIYEHLSLLMWFASFGIEHDCCVGFLFVLHIHWVLDKWSYILVIIHNIACTIYFVLLMFVAWFPSLVCVIDMSLCLHLITTIACVVAKY